jgi:hypothetical protein
MREAADGEDGILTIADLKLRSLSGTAMRAFLIAKQQRGRRAAEKARRGMVERG